MEQNIAHTSPEIQNILVGRLYVYVLTQHCLFVCRFRCLAMGRVLMGEGEGLVGTYWNISRAFPGI